MRLLRFTIFLMVFALVAFGTFTPAVAQPTSVPKATCAKPAVPYDKKFVGLKAVGLAFSTNGEGLSVPEPLDGDHLVDALSKRIREQILPYVVPNAECQIPDLEIFRADHSRIYKDAYYLKEFMARDDTLTVAVNLKVFHWQKPQIAVLRWYFFRGSAPPTVTPWGEVSGGDMIVAPLGLDPDVMEARINDAFATFTLVQTPATKSYRNLIPQDSLTPEQAQREQDEMRRKAEETKTPVPMVPLPSVPPETLMH